MSTSPSSQLEPVAAVVQRLAVLLAAGVAPASGWRYLAEDEGPAAATVRAVSTSVSRGSSIADAILAALPAGSEPSARGRRGSHPVTRGRVGSERSARRRHQPGTPSRRRHDTGKSADGRHDSDAAAWRGLAAAWFVATDAGAPLAPSLERFAASLRALAQTGRDLRVAIAAPAATARMVMALPAVGVLFGIVLGFDTVGTLFTTPPGLVCFLLGVGLMLAARAWNRKLVTAARPRELTPGLTLDLMAIAVSGGAALPRALALVAQACERCGIVADESGRGGATIAEVLALSSRAGVPAAALLRSEAEETRRDARSEGERKAATLAVTLMLPLGLCILPAFMLLGVAPLLISVVGSTVGAI